MSEEKNIYQKLHEARKYIRTCGTKRDGHNDYSNYDYFTPVQISQLVFQACEDQGLISVFNLVRNELGYDGRLEIFNIVDPKETISFQMATAIPNITATNATQQLGGAMTYTERYLLMTAFDIKDNNLDPDTTEQTKKRAESPKENAKDELKWLNKWSDKEHTKELSYYWKVVANAKENKKTVADLKLVFKIGKDVEKELINDLK